MSKDSHAVTESMIMRLCLAWLNCLTEFIKNPCKENEIEI